MDRKGTRSGHEGMNRVGCEAGQMGKRVAALVARPEVFAQSVHLEGEFDVEQHRVLCPTHLVFD